MQRNKLFCKNLYEFFFSLFMVMTDRLQPTKGTAGVCKVLRLTEQEELRLRSGPTWGFCSQTCQAVIGLGWNPAPALGLSGDHEVNGLTLSWLASAPFYDDFCMPQSCSFSQFWKGKEEKIIINTTPASFLLAVFSKAASQHLPTLPPAAVRALSERASQTPLPAQPPQTACWSCSSPLLTQLPSPLHKSDLENTLRLRSLGTPRGLSVQRSSLWKSAKCWAER